MEEQYSLKRVSKVKVRNVTKIFGKQSKTALKMLEAGKTKKEILEQTGMTVGVNKASFDIYAGEIFVIMGLSGSGKSTLVRLFNRLIEPTAGVVSIDDVDIVKMSDKELRDVRREKMGMVFQRFALFPHRTVLENAAYGLEVQGVAKDERVKKAGESLNLVGLEGYENSYPDQLSGGMQQRVGLARALANDPDILLMDEAFSALDPLIRKDMQDELLDLQQRMEKTIIFITHDLDEALRIGDRIALMKDGNIVQIGTPEEILMDPANEYVERFVEDVDLSKVLTAANVMKRAETIGIDKGPRVALQLMKERGVSTLYVVNKKRELLGAINAQDAAIAIQENTDLESIIMKDISTVAGDKVLADLFELVASSKVPVAVVDSTNRLQGIIIQGAVLGALSGNKDVIRAAGGE